MACPLHIPAFVKRSTLPVYNRSLNWIDLTSQSLQSQFPQAKDSCLALTERLAALFLERLPSPIARQLCDLLPRRCSKKHPVLHASAEKEQETSISYTEFVQRATHVLGCSNAYESEEQIEALAKQMTDAFLWSMSHGIPSEIKTRLIEILPSDLRSRLNLYSTGDDNSKVA